jgi:hypothetical protein
MAIADGAATVSGVAVLRYQPDLFGRVASAPTVWRTLMALTGETLTRIATARADTDAATGVPAGAGHGRRVRIPSMSLILAARWSRHIRTKKAVSLSRS